MEDKDYLNLQSLLDEGLLLAEKRMLQEKALHGEDVITCDAQNNIVRIPAQQVLDGNPAFQD